MERMISILERACAQACWAGKLDGTISPTYLGNPKQVSIYELKQTIVLLLRRCPISLFVELLSVWRLFFRFCEVSCCGLFEDHYVCCTLHENHIGQAEKPGGEAAAALVWDFGCANMQFGYSHGQNLPQSGSDSTYTGWALNLKEILIMKGTAQGTWWQWKKLYSTLFRGILRII